MNSYNQTVSYWSSVVMYGLIVIFIFIFAPFAFMKINPETETWIRLMKIIFILPWIGIMCHNYFVGKSTDVVLFNIMLVLTLLFDPIGFLSTPLLIALYLFYITKEKF